MIKNKVCVSVFFKICAHEFTVKDTVMFKPLFMTVRLW